MSVMTEKTKNLRAAIEACSAEEIKFVFGCVPSNKTVAAICLHILEFYLMKGTINSMATKAIIKALHGEKDENYLG